MAQQTVQTVTSCLKQRGSRKSVLHYTYLYQIHLIMLLIIPILILYYYHLFYLNIF